MLLLLLVIRQLLQKLMLTVYQIGIALAAAGAAAVADAAAAAADSKSFSR